MMPLLVEAAVQGVDSFIGPSMRSTACLVILIFVGSFIGGAVYR